MTDEQIIDALGYQKGDNAMKEQVVEDVRAIVEMRVVGLISEQMSEEQLKTFESLQENGDSQAIWHWLRNEVVGVDVSEVYEATLKDYIDQYLREQPTFQ